MTRRQRNRGRSGGTKAGTPAGGKAGRHIAATAATTPAAAPATVASTVREPLTRIRAIDALRGAAICMMIVYHAAFDLNWFHIISADFNHDRFWLSFRDLIVSSFLLLVVSSILGWPLVRFPRAALIVGIVVIVVGVAIGLPLFDLPWLNWVGLMTHKPATEDYVPLLPWFGVVLVGISIGWWLLERRMHDLRQISRASPKWLTWLGRHSLLVYMIHQPIMMGLLRVFHG